jgi:hypothetical protein
MLASQAVANLKQELGVTSGGLISISYFLKILPEFLKIKQADGQTRAVLYAFISHAYWTERIKMNRTTHASVTPRSVK